MWSASTVIHSSLIRAHREAWGRRVKDDPYDASALTPMAGRQVGCQPPEAEILEIVFMLALRIAVPWTLPSFLVVSCWVLVRSR